MDFRLFQKAIKCKMTKKEHQEEEEGGEFHDLGFEARGEKEKDVMIKLISFFPKMSIKKQRIFLKKLKTGSCWFYWPPASPPPPPAPPTTGPTAGGRRSTEGRTGKSKN